ncbi:MAG TPA: hypothetical protein VNV87_04545 [Acidimicrobiales bacterium]|jgi:hypothetical protein|nr:hypothetical protein [Acidimicrobiales bacterium]
MTTPPSGPARGASRATRTQPTKTTTSQASTRLSQAELTGLIDEGIEKSLRTALAILDDPDAAGYVKLHAANLFKAPMLNRLLGEQPQTASSPQERFLSLMREIREVPVRGIVVTEEEITDIPVDDIPEFVDERAG